LQVQIVVLARVYTSVRDKNRIRKPVFWEAWENEGWEDIL